MIATLMKEFHQPYSEIENMRVRDIKFCISLYNALKQYEKQEMDKAKNKAKNKR